jgi:HK97 family phage major capsid protein/HK97 family phage prohead protease
MLRHTTATLEIKAADDETRIVEGIATTPSPDRGGDIMEPLGAQFTLPMPFLWQHDPKQPIGQVLAAEVTPSGISIKAQIARVDEPGVLKDRLDEAYQSLKAKLVRGLSIGWHPIDILPIKGSFGVRAVKWAWRELSAVTLPQNPETQILTVKSAAPAPKDRSAMLQTLTTTERITQIENARAAKVARLSELMTKASEAGVTIDGGTDQEEYDGLELDVKKYDADLVRLRTLEALNAAAAKPVVPSASGPRSYGTVRVTSNVPPGTAFVRYAMATLASKGDSMRALQIAERWKHETPEVELLIKAAVAPADTVNPAWAGSLVQVQNATNEFIELLRPATLLGKIPGLRKIPFNTSVPVQTAGGVYGWVGQGAMKPVTKLAFTTVALQFSKAAGIIFFTEEVARFSSPDIESIVRRDMIAGIARFLDQQFIDPAVAEVANVSPGSITNGLTPTTSSQDPLTDLYTIISALTGNNVPLAGTTIIMSETNALVAALKRDANGNRLFPTMSAAGGTMEGIAVVTSQTANGWVIGVQPDLVLYADDGQVAIDVSREASIVADSAPVAPPTGIVTSLWQNNLIGLRAERWINWNRALSVGVELITGAAYPPPTTP